MRAFIITALVTLASAAFTGTALGHDEAPSPACNMGTHHAHEMAVPEFSGNGVEVKAHENIPEWEDAECVHEAHED